MAYRVDASRIEYDSLIPDTQAIWDTFANRFRDTEQVALLLEALNSAETEQIARLLSTILMEELGGHKWQIQSMQTPHFEQNDDLAVDLLSQGLALVEIVRRTGLTMHRVKTLQKRWAGAA